MKNGAIVILLFVGALFVAIGALESPYIIYPCGEPVPTGAVCTPTGEGTSAVILLGLGGILIAAGFYYYARGNQPNSSEPPSPHNLSPTELARPFS